MIARRLAAACIGATLCAGAVQAQTSGAQPSGLPPIELIESAIADAPGPAAAEADVARARATADRLRVGPYELELQAGYARRNVSGGNRDFNEWNGGVSRSFRWPDKRNADVSLAGAEVAIAEAAYDKAWRQTALDWATLWTEWRASTALAEVANAAADDAEALADAEARRVAIGSGRALDRDRLQADAALARLAAEQAERRRADAQAALTIMFPSFVLPATPPALDEAAPSAAGAPSTEDVLAETPAVLEARLRVEQADLQARRARLDQRPDPTVGLEAFSEFNGDETGLGVSVSFPLTGRARRAATREAESGRSASLASLRAAEQQARQRHARAALRVQSAARAAESARQAAAAARQAVDRIERGRAINAASVTEVISVRQAARAAETARLEALAEAAAAELELAILEGRLLDAP